MPRCTFLQIALALTCAALGGCASTTRGDDGDRPDLVMVDAVVAGKAIVARLGCPGCHDPGDGTLAGRLTPIGNGMVFPSNLTPDEETGIGTWSDEQIATAVRTGMDDATAPLCPPMPHFDKISDEEMAALIAYLRSLRPVNRPVSGSTCPPIKGSVAQLPDAAADVEDMSRGDLGTPPGDMTAARDMAMPPGDGGMPACHAVINEVQTAGNAGATDEFIEIENPCPAALDFTGVTLVYRASAGVKDVVLLQFVGKFASKTLFLCGGDGYLGLADAYYSPGTSMASKGGGVALRDANGVVLDSIGYGDATNAFVRVAAAAAPGIAESIARLPDGHDSGDNRKDFVLTGAPTPGKANR